LPASTCTIHMNIVVVSLFGLIFSDSN
jgi:hypothetical protein